MVKAVGGHKSNALAHCSVGHTHSDAFFSSLAVYFALGKRETDAVLFVIL